MDAAAYPVTASNTPTRLAERAHYDRRTVHAILDEALICHLAYVRDDRPVVIPTIHARVDQRLYLHGSTGAAVARAAAGCGVPVCVCVTVIDGLVLARSAFHHSMNYRSVVLHGTARPVADDQERAAALDAVVDHVWPGRVAACRPPTGKELAATSVLSLDLLEASAKCRTGDPVDDPADIDGPWWAGVVPVRTALGDPEPAADLRPGRPLPAVRPARTAS
jgi:nitroimidazol reductase NimA-like FMN-containing flavoprotein (pyridoxamine 5'-phosphate oxidase superfamily)